MAKRRSHGEGSIRKLAGRDLWQGRYHAPDGKRRSVYGKTRAEAARMLAQAKREAEQGIKPIDRSVTVGVFLDRFLEAARHQVRPGTFESYESHCRVHLRPAFGQMKLASLGAADVDALLGRKRDEGLSPATCNRNQGHAPSSDVPGG